jgi:vacuolar-type H+-ATPase subunit I/STV1
MNPYIIGGGVAAIALLGFLLKGSYERNGELEAKLETQAAETQECVDANVTTMTTISELTEEISSMIEERRIDTERREQVLVERERELAAANARADRITKSAETSLCFGLISSALLLLVSCATDPEVRVVTKTEIVEKEVEVTKPLPKSLTDPLVYPAGLSEGFTVGDSLDLNFDLFDLLDQANRDRAKAAELTQPRTPAPAPDIPQ